MGKKVPDSGLEISKRPSPATGLHGLLYYGGDTTNTAHTVPLDANGDDKYILQAVFEPILMAAHADVELGASGKVLEEALKGAGVPDEIGTWWDNMPAAFQADLPKKLDALFIWKFMPA